MRNEPANPEAQVIEMPFPGRHKVPPWGTDTLTSLSTQNYADLKSFLVKRRRCDQSRVVFKDIGHFISTSGDSRLTWNALIQLGRRSSGYSDLLTDADFWLDPTAHQDLSFVVIGDETYILRGTLKVAAARLALYQRQMDTLYGVRVSRWVVDWEMHDLCKMLTRLCAERAPHLSVVPVRKQIQHLMQNHWQIEQYFVALCRQDGQTGRVDVLNLAETKDWLRELNSLGAAEPRRFWSLGRRMLASA